MQFGLCGDLNMADAAARASYDYMEGSVTDLLRPLESEDAFRARLAEIQSARIAYRAANIFIPSDRKITGPDVDRSALLAYVTTTMLRAEIAGIDTIVLGSGGAREVPDGFDKQHATEQIIAFC
jgi:hypothetical protein